MVTPYCSIDYYNQLVERFGQNQIVDFLKFYLVPGFSHGRGNFMVKVDLVKALDTWVTQDKDPGTLKGADQNPNTFGRTRPVCQYPTYPEYKGSGDINSASSFSCEKP
ncbi:tannase/feruloyl esterase family alpha/beta hydrolase [Fredinandcohnia onubensis]|uniref:tannase/feruloyl esterase family alpha/beta hydrolase n=1 Tax=Fredinandcohnia onubensis TaxID=1571209 RepID=UPI003CCBD029